MKLTKTLSIALMRAVLKGLLILIGVYIGIRMLHAACENLFGAPLSPTINAFLLIIGLAGSSWYVRYDFAKSVPKRRDADSDDL